MDLSNLLAAIAGFVVVAVSPGPANIATAVIAMREGRRSSMIFGAGLGLGLALWGLVAASGIGAVLQGSIYMLTALKLFGGAYLLWLAVQSGRSAIRREAGEAGKRETERSGRWFRRGLLLNLSNPKAVVAWLAVLAIGSSANSTGVDIIATTAICIVLGFANYAFYATLFSLYGVMSAYRRFNRRVEGVVAVLLATAGFGLIRSALAR